MIVLTTHAVGQSAALASAADARRYMPVMSISIASRISYLKDSIEPSSFERIEIELMLIDEKEGYDRFHL